MNRPSRECRPQLAPGCRFSEATGQEAMLMMPEGALRLRGTGAQIVALCDGRTFAEIVSALHARFPAMEPAKIEEETAEFLEKLLRKRVVNY